MSIQCVILIRLGDHDPLLTVFGSRVARTMIACRPYNTWPLHVKLFTEDAVKIWKDVDKDVRARALPLPAGFTIQTELEGVDGKSGRSGSGRDGPIDVSDGNHSRALLSAPNHSR